MNIFKSYLPIPKEKGVKKGRSCEVSMENEKKKYRGKRKIEKDGGIK